MRFMIKARQLAETALEKHCKYLTVNTQDYQALPFYKKNGVIIFGELEDSPIEGTTKYYLKKELL